MVLTNEFITVNKDAMKDKVGSVFLNGAVGSSSTTPAVSDVRLVDEFFRDGVDITDKSVTDKITTTLIINTTEANGKNLREFGWFETSAGSSGTAFVRDNMTVISKTSDVQLYLDTSINFTLIEV